MLGLPKSTEMSKQLPKKAVYAKFQMNTAAKEKIDADISRITIVNEITPAKINIPAGEEVGSFFVLLVALKTKDFDEKTVATLSKLIPQNILFVLEFEGQSKLAIYHTKLMQTDWKPTESCTIELRGLNLTLATIQSPYIPKGMTEQRVQQQKYQNDQSVIMEQMKRIMQSNGEDKPNG